MAEPIERVTGKKSSSEPVSVVSEEKIDDVIPKTVLTLPQEGIKFIASAKTQKITNGTSAALIEPEQMRAALTRFDKAAKDWFTREHKLLA